MPTLVPLSRAGTGAVFTSPTFQPTTNSGEVSYSVSANSTTDNFVLLIRLEEYDEGIWRAVQTSKLLKGSYTEYYSPATGVLLRLTLIALSGAGVISAETSDREIPSQPPNYDLQPNSVIYVDQEEMVTELAPPMGPDLYLGTNSLGEFGYHPLPAGGGGTPQIAWNETPSGIIDGVNNTFSIAAPANPTNSVSLQLNGIRLIVGVDFVFSIDQILYHPDQIPEVGDWHRVTYQHV